MITDCELLDYFHRGLIPGPAESEEAFLERVKKSHPLPHSEWKEASQKTLPLFGFSIDWVPISYSNHKVAWWEGAVTWISEDELPAIQLRSPFQKGSFLGYRREDVLAHEAVHAARVRFEEPHFEEVLAYATSPQAWKRFLGPLMTRPWEIFVLMFSGFIAVFSPLITLLIMGLAIGWLGFRQWVFKQCSRKLSLRVILCLTDTEMRKLAWKSEGDIGAYLKRVRTLRGRLMGLLSTF